MSPVKADRYSNFDAKSGVALAVGQANLGQRYVKTPKSGSQKLTA